MTFQVYFLLGMSESGLKCAISCGRCPESFQSLADLLGARNQFCLTWKPAPTSSQCVGPAGSLQFLSHWQGDT